MNEVLPFDFLGSHFTLFEDWPIIVKSHKKFRRGLLPPAPALMVKLINS